MIFKNITTLQLKTKQKFEQNLESILNHIAESKKDSVILTPELALSGFCYQQMNEASEFSIQATEALLKASEDKTIITTMIEKKNHKFYNNLKVFSNGELVHKQAKHHLFSLGDEQLHFASGSKSEIIPFRIGEMNCGALVCFELRFIELWMKLQGVDIIFVPVQWGEARKDHLESLAKALAISNECFVVISASSNLQMAASSAIITPYGKVYSNKNLESMSQEIDLSEVTKMRKYIDIGLTKCAR